MKHRYQSFTRFGRQSSPSNVKFTRFGRRFHSLSAKVRRKMTNTYVMVFLSASIFGRSYHSRYQNFEFTG